MAGGGLLDRLEKRGVGHDSLQSVIAHLRVLLNARAGMALTVPQFGVIDFNDIVHNLPDGIRQIQTSLRTTIQTYEPRLENINVRYVRDDQSLFLRFEITAQLVDKPERTLRIVSSWHPGGLFTVDT
jgi:type VI secretion system protein